VQIPAYRSFSEGYEVRICVDLSLTGLRAAKRRLGEHAVCIAGDITRLPIREGVIDSVVSLHTLYHVPADEQTKAVAELVRVAKPGGRVVIVSSWGASSLLHRAWVWLAARLPERKGGDASITLPSDVDLYFSPQNYRWYRREIAPRYASRLRIWRSVGKEFMQRFVHSRISAWLLLGPLLAFESIAPRLAGRVGVCPMFVIDKPHL
jgi:ubiquinone/menaquinone biosynthesis C-methylase UbiE